MPLFWREETETSYESRSFESSLETMREIKMRGRHKKVKCFVELGKLRSLWNL
jgi:hypothetical protein